MELLAPAGNWDCLSAAVKAKCNSVYFGLKELNMRKQGADNFELSELKKVVDFCHSENVRAYLCVNTIAYDNDFKKVVKILKEAKNANVDAIICSDMGVVALVNEFGLECHISTQVSVSNYEAVKFYSKYADRFVLARELSLEQINEIHERIKKENLKGRNGLIQIECFGHGAMCVAVSGRCFMSGFLLDCSANRGECLQPCRREYKIIDNEEGHELIIGDGYVMSPKDLCTIEILDKIKCSALKIEGRGRNADYVYTVVSCYRKALDAISKNEYSLELKKELFEELKKVYNRGLSTGFYIGRPMKEWCGVYGSLATESKRCVGIVHNYFPNIKVAEVKLFEELESGCDLIVTGKTTGYFRQKLEEMQINNKYVTKAKGLVGIKVHEKVRKNDKIWRIENNKD